MKSEGTELTPIKETISRFDGEYSFLSNFDEHEIAFGYFIFGNNEALYQSLKSDDINVRAEFENLRPSDAKKKGRTITIREDWDDYKYHVMFNTCAAKFAQNPDLLEKLIATGDAELIEGNSWGDTYWGVCKGEGKNSLGKILMELRKSFQEESFLQEALFLAQVRKQFAAFIKEQRQKSAIAIIDNGYEIGFYTNLIDYLIERFPDEDDFEQEAVTMIQQAFVNGKIALPYLYERFLSRGEFADDDSSLFEFLKDEVQNLELYRLQ